MLPSAFVADKGYWGRRVSAVVRNCRFLDPSIAKMLFCSASLAALCNEILGLRIWGYKVGFALYSSVFVASVCACVLYLGSVVAHFFDGSKHVRDMGVLHLRSNTKSGMLLISDRVVDEAVCCSTIYGLYFPQMSI